MIIKPTCPNCGKQITINILKVKKLQDRIEYLEKENRRLNTIIKASGQSSFWGLFT